MNERETPVKPDAAQNVSVDGPLPRMPGGGDDGPASVE